MKKMALGLVLCFAYGRVCCWGFYMHRQINYHAVFLLPPPMLAFFKPNIGYLSEHASDPDKRRYLVKSEGSRHFIDIDRYGPWPYAALPRVWDQAVAKFSRDTIEAYGIVPWCVETMTRRLTRAFRDRDPARILKTAADLGHYVADAHVPLHACTNHNGQLSHQEGIHAFWESRIPELLAEKNWDFFIGRAAYVPDIGAFIWRRVLESGAAADTVLRAERRIADRFRDDRKYAFGLRNGKLVRQYADAYTNAYDEAMNGMVERRMRESIFAVACLWYTAWVDAGQPDLRKMGPPAETDADRSAMDSLNLAWKSGTGAEIPCAQ